MAGGSPLIPQGFEGGARGMASRRLGTLHEAGETPRGSERPAKKPNLHLQFSQGETFVHRQETKTPFTIWWH